MFKTICCGLRFKKQLIGAQYIEKIFNEIENTFNETFAGQKSMSQALGIYFI